MRRLTTALLIALLAVSFVGGFSYQSYAMGQAQIRQANQNQLLSYQNAILADQLAHAQKSETPGNNQSIGYSVQAYVAMYLGTKDSIPNSTLTKEGFVPNCLLECPGITYYKDPTTVVTNEGHDYIQFMLTGNANTVTPGSTDRAVGDGLSTSATGALVTDSLRGSGPCSVNGGLIGGSLFNTLSPNIGSVSVGAPAAGSVTWTVTYTWTYSIGLNTVNSGCLLTGTFPSGAVTSTDYLFAEVSGVGPFTLAAGDTLKEVWSVTAT